MWLTLSVGLETYDRLLSRVEIRKRLVRTLRWTGGHSNVQGAMQERAELLVSHILSCCVLVGCILQLHFLRPAATASNESVAAMAPHCASLDGGTHWRRFLLSRMEGGATSL